MRIKFLITISLVFFLLFGFSTSIFAATASQVQAQISSINDQIKELDKEIALLSNQIAETAEQKNTLTKAIQGLNLTRNKLLVERTQIQKKITATGLLINEISNNIDTKEESIGKSEAGLKKMIYSMYQTEKDTFLELMLSENKFEEFSTEYNNVLSINKSVRNYINQLIGQKEELSTAKVQKLDEQDQLNILKKTLIAKETAVLNTKKEKDALLTQTKNQETAYQKILAEQLKRKESFEREMADYEAQLKLIINPKLLPKAGSGVLSWPLSYILITSNYGSRWSSFHYGLDFRAAVGTSVKAMASGEVIGTGDTDIACKGASFGKWVFIKYNNGLSSTYGHLSVISAQKGQKVKAGDIVGLSGNTGSSTGPHLHVAVYASDGVKVNSFESKSCIDKTTNRGKIITQPMITASDAYLNPLLYLPKTTTSMYK